MAHTEVRKSRVLVAAAGLLLCLIALWARLVWLQIVCHERFEARAERNQEQRVLLPPVRGELLDRHGRPLARDLVTCAISAAPGEMKDRPRSPASWAGCWADPRVLGAHRAPLRFQWVARGPRAGRARRRAREHRDLRFDGPSAVPARPPRRDPGAHRSRQQRGRGPRAQLDGECAAGPDGRRASATDAGSPTRCRAGSSASPSTATTWC